MKIKSCMCKNDLCFFSPEDDRLCESWWAFESKQSTALSCQRILCISCWGSKIEIVGVTTWAYRSESFSLKNYVDDMIIMIVHLIASAQQHLRIQTHFNPDAIYKQLHQFWIFSYEYELWTKKYRIDHCLHHLSFASVPGLMPFSRSKFKLNWSKVMVGSLDLD